MTNAIRPEPNKEQLAEAERIVDLIFQGGMSASFFVASVLAERDAKAMVLRRLLWIRHGCEGLYGDDGEMQCGMCILDFKREEPEQIEERFRVQGLAQLAKAQEVKTAPVDDLLEIVAEQVHMQWSGWAEHMLGEMRPRDLGSLNLSPSKAERWRRQIATPYAELSEEEKESDRREARKILAVLPKTCGGCPTRRGPFAHER